MNLRYGNFETPYENFLTPLERPNVELRTADAVLSLFLVRQPWRIVP